MKKTLISLAVAGAFIAPSAMAEVTTYGLVQAELAQTKPKEGDSSLNLLDNSNGRLGVKASEDLGNGWKGLAKLEFKIDTVDNNVDSSTCSAESKSTATDLPATTPPTTSTTTAVSTTTTCSVSNKVALSGRESLVGLKGSAGTFTAGVLKQASKYMGGVTYDAFVATALEARKNGGMDGSAYGAGAFHVAALGYENKFGPVKVMLTYSPQTDDGRMNVGAEYEANGIQAFLTTASSGKDAYTATADKKTTTSKIGGSYKMGGHKIMLQLENVKSDPGTSGGTTTTDKYTYLAYHGKFGKTMFIFQYGMYKEDDAADTATSKSHDQTYLALGAKFMFSKETALYGGYRAFTKKDVDADSNNIISVGLIKKF